MSVRCRIVLNGGVLQQSSTGAVGASTCVSVCVCVCVPFFSLRGSELVAIQTNSSVLTRRHDQSHTPGRPCTARPPGGCSRSPPRVEWTARSTGSRPSCRYCCSTRAPPAPGCRTERRGREKRTRAGGAGGNCENAYNRVQNKRGRKLESQAARARKPSTEGACGGHPNPSFPRDGTKGGPCPRARSPYKSRTGREISH